MDKDSVSSHRPLISTKHTVAWIDTDASGHQHNSIIIRWFEIAEAQLMRELDLPEYFPSAPRVQQVINFTGKLWFGQQATTNLWIERLGNTSLKWGFEVVRCETENSPETSVANGSVTTVYLPSGASSSEAWPDKIRRTLEQAKSGPEQR